MIPIRSLAVFVILAALAQGCATSTAPTHITLETSGEIRRTQGPVEAVISDEESDVHTAIAELQGELADLRRQLESLEANQCGALGESAEEPPERVAGLGERQHSGVVTATCEEPLCPECAVAAKEVSGEPADLALAGQRSATERQILEQALLANRAALAVIANNLANANTTGFKKDRVSFEDLGYRHEVVPGVQDSAGQCTPVGIAFGGGSRVAGVQTEFAQGTLLQTGRPLDVAISGKGFFQVKDPNGQIVYTRTGNFSVNSNQQIVVGSAATGRVLDPPITVPNDWIGIVIEPEGRVMVQQANNPTLQQAGQVTLATFVNQEGLLKLGENLYAQSDASGVPIISNPGCSGAGLLRQNMLEASNVDPEVELFKWQAVNAQVRLLRRLLAN